MSAKEEMLSDAAFKAWPFSFDFNFACKDGRVTAVTCKYCPLVVNPIVTDFCKKFHLKCIRVPRSIFENFCSTIKHTNNKLKMRIQDKISLNGDTKVLFFSHINLHYIQMKTFNTLLCIILHVVSNACFHK